MIEPRVASSADDLRALPTLLAASGLEAMQLRVIESTDSTNDDLRDVSLEKGAWRVLVADQQWRGRGRSGAAWFSPSGTALHLSLATRLALPVDLWPRASLVVGLSAAQALRSLLSLDVRLKWPNDLMIQTQGAWRKLGGVLCERVEAAGQGARWIAGLGLNYCTPPLAFPPSLRPHVASLNDLSPSLPSRAEVLAALIVTLRQRIDAFVLQEGALDLAGLSALLLFVGRQVSLDLGDGGPPQVSRLVGLAPSGSLLVGEVDDVEGLREVQPLRMIAADTEPPWRAAPLLPHP